MRRTVGFAFLGFVPVLFTACAAESRPSTLVRGPQRWEYQTVKLDENGERTLGNLMTAMGRDGWEYAGQVTGKDEYLVFKRPMAYGGAAVYYGPTSVTIPAATMRFATASSAAGPGFAPRGTAAFPPGTRATGSTAPFVPPPLPPNLR